MLETHLAPSQKALRTEEEQPATARLLSIHSPAHRLNTVTAIRQGEPAVIAFNGIFGIFGDAHTPHVADKIMQMKERPQDKKLIVVSAPEHLDEVADFSVFPYSHQQVIALQTKLHALGVILPASQDAPSHLTVEGAGRTVLSIWTEYEPFRDLMTEFRRSGGRALTGTSANKSGAATHHNSHSVFADFKHDVPIVLGADFSHLPEVRRRSTSVIRFDGETPVLHREGNVSYDEINEALIANGFPVLDYGNPIQVRVDHDVK